MNEDDIDTDNGFELKNPATPTHEQLLEQAYTARLNFKDALLGGKSPDETAAELKIARKFSVPPGLADSVTDVEKADAEADQLKWEEHAMTQSIFQQAMGSPDFANLVKDDLPNTGAIASTWYKMFSDRRGQTPEGLWASLVDSTARGGYALVNSLGYEAIASKLHGDLEQIDATQKRIDAGESDAQIWGTEYDPSGAIGRAMWNANSASQREAAEKSLRQTAESIAWTSRMTQMFPNSDFMTEFSQTKDFSTAAGMAFAHPLQLLADTGMESLVQYTPMFLLGAVAPEAAAPIAAGMYSYGLDSGASLLSRMSDLGVDLTNADQVYNFYRNDPRFAEESLAASRHATMVSIFDALSYGVAGMGGRPASAVAQMAQGAEKPAVSPIRSAMARKGFGTAETAVEKPAAPKSFAPNAARAYEATESAPFKNDMMRLAAQTLVQGSLGAAGEATGQLAADGEITSWADVIAEFAGEGFTAPVEVMSATRGAWLRQVTKAENAKKFKEYLDHNTQAVQASKAGARDFTTLQGMVKKAEEAQAQRGEAPAAISLNAEMLKQAGFDKQMVAAVLRGADGKPTEETQRAAEALQKAIDEAAVTGGDVVVPSSQYMLFQRDMGEKAFELNSLARPIGEQTEAEAAQAARDILMGQPAELTKAFAKQPVAFRNSLAKVGHSIASALAGKEDVKRPEHKGNARMSMSEQKAACAVVEQLVGALAVDSGVSPEAIWNEFGLRGVLEASDVELNDKGQLIAKTKKAQDLLTKSDLVDLNQPSQEKEAPAKGAYLRDPRVIIRWAGADQSTFVHEMGHLYLDMRVKVAMRLKALPTRTPQQQRIVDLTEKAVKWLGAKSLEDFDGMPLDKQRGMHEKFARTFERYLAEGNAPTKGLLHVFRQFKGWMMRCYGALFNIPGAEISDEVRCLFDGLFVAQEEEAAARALRGFYNYRDVLEKAGGADEEAEKKLLDYVDQYFAATQAEAQEALQAKALRSMSYLRRLRNGIVRNFNREAEKYRKQYEAEERAKLEQEEGYATVVKMIYGVKRTVDGVEQIFRPRLSLQELAKLDLEKGMLARLEKRGYTVAANWNKNAVPGEEFAKSEGFPSLKELAEFLGSKKDPREDIEAELEGRVDARMVEEHAELHDDESIQRAADEALYNPSASAMLAAEINYLERNTGDRQISSEFARGIARAQMGAVIFRELRPVLHRNAAALLGKQALLALRNIGKKKRDVKKAAELKRRQLYQTAYAAEAQKTLDYVRSIIDRMKSKYNKNKLAGSMDREFQLVIQSLLLRFHLINNFKGNRDDIYFDYQKFEAACAKNGVAAPALPPEVEQGLKILRSDPKGETSLYDLPTSIVEAVTDFFVTLEAQGRLANTAIVNGQHVDLLKLQAKIANDIVKQATATERERLELGQKDDWKKRVKAKLRAIGTSHRRIQSLFVSMEGGHGTIYEAITKMFDLCATREEQMKHDAAVKFDDAFRKLWTVFGDRQPRYYKGLKASLTPAQLFCALLNLGNEQNRQRLLDGSDRYEWTDGGRNGTAEKWKLKDLVEAIGNTFTDEQIRAAQEIWNICGSLWPDCVDLEKRMGHRSPERVAPSPIVITRGGEAALVLEGGYYPISYDRELNTRSTDYQEVDEALTSLNFARGAATTQQGHLISRAESGGGQPVALTPEAGFEGLVNTIHDLCWREAVGNANKIFRKGGAAELAIRQYWGEEAVKGIRDWVNDIANANSSKATSEIASFIRRNVSLAGIGLNLVTALIQPVGILQSVAVLGGKWCLAGIGDYIRNPRAQKALVESKSDMMAARSRTRFKEVAEVQLRMQGAVGRTRDKMMRAAYMPVVAMQAIVDIPTWIGAYNKALAEGMYDLDAVAYADRIVIEAQGSGRLSDLSRVERDKGWGQLFTTFYSFFNAAYNIMMVTKDTEKGMERAWHLLILLCMQPVIETFLREGLKAAVSNKDDDDWLRKTSIKAALAIPNFSLNLMVGLRETANIVELLTGQQATPYQGPAGMRLMTDTLRLAGKVGKAIEKGEIDEAVVKAVISEGGLLLGYPVAPINRFISGANAIRKDETTNPGTLLLGYSDRY